MRILSFGLVVGALALAATACSNHGPAPAAPAEGPSGGTAAATGSAASAITDDARADAKQIFATDCTPCHGAEGFGNGVASGALNPKPRNFHDKAWQAKVTDDHIEQTIQYGGAAVGLSPVMPAHPDLASKPATLAALRELVRGFGK